MFPDPLHPAIVHFPIVLAVLAPLFAAAAAWAIHTKRLPARSWIGIIIFQIVLVLSAWVAMETGEREEDLVERVVSERAIEDHEEAGERFQVLAALVLPLAAAGMLAGGIGTINRVLTIVLSLFALLAVGEAGHTGGELIYYHGAAAAYTQTATADGQRSLAYSGHHDDDHDDDDDYHDDDD